MADEKWSSFPAASSVSDADYTALVQGGTNKRGAFSVIKAYMLAAFNSVYVPLTRTLTIGGSAQSLAANRTWTTSDILDSLGSTQGDVLVRSNSAWIVLAPGTSGNVLTTHGAALNPSWDASSAAPSTAHYLTSQSESSLSNEVNLGALTTGLLKGTVSGSVSTISSITDSSTNWDTAYTERHQWDGGSTNLVAATGRTSLGGTTLGQNVFTITNPSAITFPRFNADNSVSALDAASFRTAIGAGTGGGDASTDTSTSVNLELATFKSTTGKLLQRATGTGIATLTSGVLSATATTGSGNVVLATSPTLVTPVLGTPSSGTLTSCTGLPVASVVGDTTTALGVGSIELGHATDTTLSRNSAGVLQVEGVVVPTISSTNTITNKRNTRRAPAVTQSATPTINTDNTDVAHITALAQAITSMTTNLSGTPVEGDTLRIDITDNGTARAITWGASFEASTVALPTTTVISTRLDVGFLWNTVTTKWRCVAVA